MAEVTTLNIKIDRDLKAEADRLFNDMGMNLTTAVNVFVRQAVQEKAIPFKIYRSTDDWNAATTIEQRRTAMQEIRELLADVDGNDIDLHQVRDERRSNKYDRVN